MFTCQLSNQLLELGHQVYLVYIFPGNKESLPFSGKMTGLGGNEGSRFTDFPAWRKLAQIINDFEPDLVQANAGDSLKYAVFSKMLFRWKYPIVSRNASEVGRYLSSYFQKQITKFLYLQVDFVFSVSQRSKEDIIDHFPFLLNKTKVIPVGLDSIDTILPEQFQFGFNHIVHVGGFSFEKNHAGLLRIFSSVKAHNAKVQLHLIGDGPLKESVRELVDEMYLNESVFFHGYVSNPLSYISPADVLVLPSIIEGLPGVLLEAMYCKTPVVAYNVGGVGEIINKSTGTIIEKDAEEEFALAVINALQNPDQEKIENAYKMVRNHFMNREIALKFVNSYQKLVKAAQ